MPDVRCGVRAASSRFDAFDHIERSGTGPSTPILDHPLNFDFEQQH
jgi:hypothetical protein